MPVLKKPFQNWLKKKKAKRKYAINECEELISEQSLLQQYKITTTSTNLEPPLSKESKKKKEALLLFELL